MTQLAFRELICGIVALLQLLNKTSSTDMWIRHAGGAARLIELRGPDRFQTDFELSLFMTHAGPIVSNFKQRCQDSPP